MKQLLLNAQITNEGRTFVGSLLIKDSFIKYIYEGTLDIHTLPKEALNATIHNCEGLFLFPGGIDDQVHFRDPGLTHKGDIESESKSAIAGGITSFMDMPNTKPATINRDALLQKHERAANVSWGNYSFFIGGTNTNAQEIFPIEKSLIPGIKLFLGASTGNMLVDNAKALDEFFAESPHRIAIHSESEDIIQANKKKYILEYGEDPPLSLHPLIRSEEACYRCTSEAMERATKFGTRLHILHLSTAKEAKLLMNDRPLSEKKITAEVCVHHLWFTDQDYNRLGTSIKWNPAVKTAEDREELRRALVDNRLDIVATDHAPHLKEEKQGGALKAASGGPLVQHSLLAMLEMSKNNIFSKELVVDKMAHKPAELFRIEKRGYIRKGYYADLVLIDPHTPTLVSSENILSRCAWSPFEGEQFSYSIHTTFVNGTLCYQKRTFIEKPPVYPLIFG